VAVDMAEKTDGYKELNEFHEGLPQKTTNLAQSEVI